MVLHEKRNAFYVEETSRIKMVLRDMDQVGCGLPDVSTNSSPNFCSKDNGGL
jgi:hypothetical protein